MADKIKIINRFIKKANEKHNNKYDYMLVNKEYKNANSKIPIICKDHGIFWQTPGSHLYGSGCPNKSCYSKKIKRKLSKTTKIFIQESLSKHNDFYDYSLVDYENNRKKIIIICPLHGKFEQIPKDHTNGSGCPKCGSFKSGIFNIADEELEIESTLYFVKVFNYNELFYKLGITTKTINERFKKIKKYYDFEIIDNIKMKLKNAKLEEELFKRNFKDYVYFPKIHFDGWTECFKEEIYDVMFPG